MKELIIFYPPPSSPELARTKYAPIDGEFTVIDSNEDGVAVRFSETDNVAIFGWGEVVFDRVKRKRSPDPEKWYRTAVALLGHQYPDGTKICDIWSKSRVFLDNGRVVCIDHRGALPGIIVHCRPAYLRWRDLMKEPSVVEDTWHDFMKFQSWYMRTKPKGSKRWSLRSVDGTYGPNSCGFDDRLDLPSLGATVRYGRIVR